MSCFITKTGSFLPGEPIENDQVKSYLGTLHGEGEVREKIFRMNGIKSRHYALTTEQESTYNLYEMGVLAAEDCLSSGKLPISYLSAGSTNTPLIAPGLSSRLHDYLSTQGLISGQVEINSNSGICTSSAQALVNAIRAVKSGEHKCALSLGLEQPSDILKSSVIKPEDDRDQHDDIRKSKWFMSVFLRSMLSDGAGAMLLNSSPYEDSTSFEVNWTYSRSFANETPLCMKLENRTLLLSQDVEVLAQYMKPCVQQLMNGALSKHGEDLSEYRFVLPHLSSFFFKRFMLSVLKQFCGDQTVENWTNLETRGNTGSASIYIMLDEFRRTTDLKNGEKIMLFIPESGQFNFVLVSLTVVK